MNTTLPIIPLWRPGEHILIALSGGADSVALLLLLTELKQAYNLRLSAAHLEHGIRGEDALHDARFVESLCDRLSVPLTLAHADIPALSKQRGVGIEQAARDERHAFLRRTQKAISADHIALAHHADDQAETILMHLLRGAGPKGISGMLQVDEPLIRPLLHVTKAELLAYLKERNQPYVTDLTNFEPDTPRNALRLLVMPELQKIYPGTVRALCRHAAIAHEEDILLAAYAAQWRADNVRRLPMGTRIMAVPNAPRALVRRVLHELCPELDYDALQRLAELYNAPSGKCSLSATVTAERVNRSLYILNELNEDNPARALTSQTVPLRDGATLPDLCTLRVTASGPAIIRDNPYRQVMNASAFPEDTVLRTRRPGDRFHMLGAPGDKLLSDVLIDRKVDRPIRDFLPLVATGNRVLWLPGIGIAHEARITDAHPPSEKALLITYEGERLLV